MRTIQMTKTKMGSPDGIEVREYVAGVQYQEGPFLSENLADIFLKERWAKDVTAEVAKQAAESARREAADADAAQKAVAGAPENKAIGGVDTEASNGEKGGA